MSSYNSAVIFEDGTTVYGYKGHTDIIYKHLNINTNCRLVLNGYFWENNNIIKLCKNKGEWFSTTDDMFVTREQFASLADIWAKQIFPEFISNNTSPFTIDFDKYPRDKKDYEYDIKHNILEWIESAYGELGEEC